VLSLLKQVVIKIERRTAQKQRSSSLYIIFENKRVREKLREGKKDISK